MCTCQLEHNFVTKGCNRPAFLLVCGVIWSGVLIFPPMNIYIKVCNTSIIFFFINLSRRYESIPQHLQKLEQPCYTCSKVPWYFVYLFIFFFTQSTLLVYTFLIMVIENFQKNHWIQHENTQHVVVTKNQNKLL